MHRTIVLILISFTGAFASAATQTQNIEPLHTHFETFNQLIRELRHKVGGQNSRSTSQLDEIQRSIASLQIELHNLADQKIFVTEEFVRSLDAEAEVLQNLIKMKVQEEGIFRTLAYVNEDLKLKIDYIHKTPAKKVTMTGVTYKYYYYYNGGPQRPVLVLYEYTATVKGPVSVTVYTKTGNTEVKGYEVWYVEKGLVDFPNYHKRFDNLSSPTTLNLSPGAYFVWTRSQSRETPREPMNVGGQGSTQRYEIAIIPKQ